MTDGSVIGFDAARDGARVDGGVTPDGGSTPDGTVFMDAAVGSDAGACAAPATVIITEVAPDIPLGTDLVELKVRTSGSLNGIRLRMHQGAGSSAVLATLPAICAAAGDVVVVHLTPTTGNGNAPASELASKNEHPPTTYSANFVGAWDVNGSATGITATDVVLTLSAADNAPLDGVALSNMDGTSSATYTTSLANAQTTGVWLPANCGAATCSDTSTPTAQSVAVDFSTVGTTPAGLTAQRAGTTDTHTKADWAVATGTFGM